MHIFDISVFGFHIAPTWYGFMYALGFIFCYHFVGKYSTIRKADLDNLLFYIFLGVIGGGRIGYVLLYNPIYFIENPEEIFALWNGGMSFHGGFMGVLIAVYMFSRRYHYRFFDIADILAICIPVALGLGRIGNWINGELPGYSGYSGPFAMSISGESHFPSPLLQAFLEGGVLFTAMIILWRILIRAKKYQNGILSGVFLIGYALVRILAEQFRLPDTHIGYLFSTGWVTLGIIYTVPLLVAGIIIVMRSRSR